MIDQMAGRIEEWDWSAAFGPVYPLSAPGNTSHGD
jgi:hypothetical protein